MTDNPALCSHCGQEFSCAKGCPMTLTEDQREIVKLKRDNESMRAVLMHGLPECELHQAMLEVMNHQNLEWTEEYAKLELEVERLRERIEELEIVLRRGRTRITNCHR